MMQLKVSGSVWRRYSPSNVHPWNLRRVQHLHRRAGFGATWNELQRDLASGFEAAVDRLMHGGENAEGFESTLHLLGDSAVGTSDINRLKAWWFYRMLYSGDPLTERMTLLWHNHFATSNLKVASVALMKRQNELIRKHSLGTFGELVRAVVKDAAMLVWLDANANRKGQPNENLARELMELFTLGVGHYSESDVKEVARSLTGWTVRDNEFTFVEAHHDKEAKKVLVHVGNFDGDAVLDILLQQDSVATRLAKRLCELFFGEGGVGDAQVVELADGLREHELDIRWGVETILHSEAFFSEANMGSRILEPVQFIINPLRSLELTQPPPSTILLAEWSEKLGQDLFYPPNVFGWPGGRSWLSTRTLIARVNYLDSLMAGELHRPSLPVDTKMLSRKHASSKELSETQFISLLLLGQQRPADDVASILKSAEMQLG